MCIAPHPEYIEWWAAFLGGAAATDFLGTQGDPWDTQWDMFLAFIGALTAQVILGRRHDRELQALAHPEKDGITH